MNILVTGAAGFIGAFLCKKLLETTNDQIIGLDNMNDYYDVSLKEERLKMLDYNETFGSGITGIAVLSESHTAVHTFPEKEDPFMSVCLYSCKWFDANDIITYSNMYWKVKENHYVIMDRHIGEPQHIVQDCLKLSLEYSLNLG